MKTIALIIALAGFTAAGSYAQNKDCSGKSKTATAKAVYKSHKQPLPTCFMLKKENFGIPGCVDVTYGSSNSYLGYYPKAQPPAIPGVANGKTNTAHKIVKTKETTLKTTYPVLNVPLFKEVNDQIPLPCYTYRQNNIVVKECPDDFYKSDEWPKAVPGSLEYNLDNTYMGNYPKTQDVNSDDNSLENKPMEDKPIEGFTMPGENLQFWDSYKQNYNTK